MQTHTSSPVLPHDESRAIVTSMWITLFMLKTSLVVCNVFAHPARNFVVDSNSKINLLQSPFGMEFHYGFCELNTRKVMANLNLNSLHLALSHKFQQGILLSKLLVKVVHLSFKAFYLSAKLRYKRTLCEWVAGHRCLRIT